MNEDNLVEAIAFAQSALKEANLTYEKKHLKK